MNALIKRRENCQPTVIWDEFNRFEKSMQEFFKDPFYDSWHTARFPKIDLIEESDKYIIYAALPGFSKEQVDISQIDNRIVISGKKEDKGETVDKDGSKVLVREIARRNFSRAIAFEKDCNFSKVKASFKSGELKVEIPKTKETKDSVRKISID